jgi:hypothetical protein
MIALRRRRSASAIPAAFKQPKLGKKSELLVTSYYQAVNGKIEWDSGQWKPAKGALKQDSHGKCAYCEAPVAVVAHGDVEHFRPKSIYWWLAFAFDNYLFSCQICNQTHKADKFPVQGPRVVGPAMAPAMPAGQQLADLHTAVTLDPMLVSDANLIALWSPEQAELVNPYLEDPESLFVYEIDAVNEEVWIRSAGTPRADQAIQASHDCLGLNRDELRSERFIHLAQLIALNKLLSYSLPQAARAVGIAEVKRMMRPREPFAGMRRFFARQWGLAA